MKSFLRYQAIRGIEMRTIKQFLFLPLATILYISCSQAPGAAPPPDQSLPTPNPIFPGAILITVGVPQANSTVSTTPEFSWEATGQQLVFLAVFNTNIIVSNNAIANPQNIVWAWNTGLGTGREGSVFFSDGESVVNGKLAPNSPPTPLISGQTYVWAVWAWDNNGYKISNASTETFFTAQ
jgi:hypothetical protein